MGFLTTGILFPEYLSVDQVGLLKLLVSVMTLFAQFGSLGFNNVTTRLFPYFRDKEKKHHGYFLAMISVALLGFVVVCVGFLLMKPMLIEHYQEKSSLFIDYIFLIIPLIFFQLFFTILDTYYKVLFNAVFGTVLKDVVQRVFILLSLVLFVFDLIDFDLMVYFYAGSLAMPTVLLFARLLYEKEISLHFDRAYYRKRLVKVLLNTSLYGIILSYSGALIINIDTLMVNHYLGLEATGIYAITFFFGTLILIPGRPLGKIAGVVIAEAFKKKDYQQVAIIFRKSILNQSLIAMLIFIGLWGNIDNVFRILPPEYEAGKYVILFISVANVFDMMAGVSNLIIFNSRYYRIMSVFLSLFVVLIVLTNIIFIPMWGMIGAAVASMISRFIYTTLRVFYVYKKFHFQPFNSSMFKLLAVSVISYIAGVMIPEIDLLIPDIVLRSFVILVSFVLFSYLWKISDDVNGRLDFYFKFITGKLKM